MKTTRSLPEVFVQCTRLQYAQYFLISAMLLVLLLIISPFSIAATGTIFTATSQSDIKLVPGWNFISSPYADTPLNIDTSSCGADAATLASAIPAIYHYNPATGSYNSLTSLSSMKPGLGYWVYLDAEKECLIKFSGSNPVTVLILGDSSDGKLKAGWNQISGTTQALQLKAYLSSEALKQQLGGSACVVESIYGYDTKVGAYFEIEKKGFEDKEPNKIEVGKAYWVYANVEKECELAKPEPENQLPVAEISVPAAEGDAPFKVIFDAGKSIDNDGSIASYSWNFGDGSSGDGVSAEHVFSGAGEYSVILTITDNRGGKASSGISIKVTAPPKPKPKSVVARLKRISPVTDKYLNGVWGFTNGISSTFFAVGDQGTIIYYDGSAFKDMSVDIPQNFNAVWGFSKDSFFAVGNAGIIYHFDGTSWSKMISGTTKDLRAVWGTSNDNVYAAGSNVVLHYDGIKWSELTIKLSSYELDTVVGRGPNEIYFGGSDADYNCLVLLYSNSKWSKVNVANAPIYGIRKGWSNSKDVYLQGLNSIVHYDGTDWKTYQIIYYDIYGRVGWIWAESGNRIFYLNKGSAGRSISYGSNAAIYTGSDTLTLQTGDSSILSTSAVWGDSEKNLFAVGYDGLMMHYDGQNWKKLETELPTPTSTSTTYSLSTRAAWGSSNNDIYILRQKLYHYNGESWSELSGSPTAGSFIGAWADSKSNIIALAVYSGNTYNTANGLFKYDGTAWSKDSGSPGVNYFDYTTFKDIGGTSQKDLYIIGSSNTVLHFDGTSWTKISTISGTNNWNALWAPSSDNIYIAGSYYSSGYKGIIAHYDGKTWSKADITSAKKDFSFRKILGISANNVYVFGDAGVVFKYDGTSWKELDLGLANSNNFYPSDAWALSQDDIYAVGSLYGGAHIQPLLIHYDGASWSKIDISSYCPANAHCSLSSILGMDKEDIYVSGTFNSENKILHYDGSSWSKSGFTLPNIKINKFLGFSKNNIIALGNQGLIANYDGNAWSILPEKGSFDDLASIGGISSDNVYLVGTDKILRFDGKYWSSISMKTINAETYNPFRRTWASSSENFFVASQRGPIYHFDGTSWSKISSPVNAQTSEEIRFAWGDSKNNVFVVTDYNWDTKSYNIMHYDGTKWSIAAKITDYGYRSYFWTQSFWGKSASNLYYIDKDKSLMHFDGSAWSKVDLGAAVTVYAVHGDKENVYVTGTERDAASYTNKEFLYVYDGTSWSKTDLKVSSVGDYFGGGIISGTKDNLYINDKGTTLLRYGT